MLKNCFVSIVSRNRSHPKRRITLEWYELNWSACVCELKIDFLVPFWLAIQTRGVGAVAGLNPACLIL